MIELLVIYGTIVLTPGPFAQTDAAIIAPDMIIPRQALAPIEWEIVQVDSLPIDFSPFTYQWVGGQLVAKA
jgi:hypothetical protein